MLKTQNESKVPESWEIRRLGEICFTTSGGTPSRKISSYYEGTIPWVKSGELEKGTIKETEEYISQDALKNSSAKIFPKGTLLIALYGATIGKLGFLGVDAATNQAVCGIFQNDIVDLSFLKHFLFFSKRKLVEQSAGGAQPNISQAILKDLSIVIPPANEQKRIVAKIEELFSRLEAGVDSLKKAQAQLKTYRQAVLKWAFEGKLTNPCLMDKELPERWQKLILENIAEKVQIGPFGSQLHKEDYIENGIPLINPMHIHSGEIVPDYSFSILPEKRDSLPNYILQAGDIIMGRRGEMGRCGLVQEKENGWFCGTGSLYIRPKKHQVSPKFLHLLLSSFEVKKYLEENAAGTTMANLNKKIIHNIPIHLPSLKEQTSIIAEIEKRLSVCDKLEESIAQSLKQAEALKQSILKKAFEGKLVPQNPNEEPASMLLDRISSAHKKPAAKNSITPSKNSKP